MDFLYTFSGTNDNSIPAVSFVVSERLINMRDPSAKYFVSIEIERKYRWKSSDEMTNSQNHCLAKVMPCQGSVEVRNVNFILRIELMYNIE